MSDAFGFEEVPLGHNRPPSGIVSGEALRASLEREHSALCERRDVLIAAEARLPAIADDESAGRVSDYIKQITTAGKSSDAARVAAKEPYLEGSRAVDGFFTKGITDPLNALKRRVEAALTRYLQDKAAKEREARLEVERAARAIEDAARKEAEAKASAMRTASDLDRAMSAANDAAQASANRMVAEESANAKPAELSRTRGDYGSVASLRTNWEYEIVDVVAVPRAFMMVNDAAVKAHMKARQKDKTPGAIDGIRFYEKTSAAVR